MSAVIHRKGVREGGRLGGDCVLCTYLGAVAAPGLSRRGWVAPWPDARVFGGLKVKKQTDSVQLKPSLAEARFH